MPWNEPGTVAGVAVLVATIAFGLWVWWRGRPDAAEIERRRRASVNRHGRMVDATIMDVQGNTIWFTYTVRGMTYTACQDVTALTHLLPENLLSILGPATAKYHLANPANSIVVCEEWSGIRLRETPGRKEPRSPAP